MKTAIATLSPEGLRVGLKLLAEMEDAHLFVHEVATMGVPGWVKVTPFTRVADVLKERFREFSGWILILPCGVAVRALAPLVVHKLEDPAVVVVDVGGRWAVSLLSGHEGGANDLALEAGNILGADPVISTTTEAVKQLIVGLGCRKGARQEDLVAAIHEGLSLVGQPVAAVRYLASADVKKNEPGLLAAAEELGLPLRFLTREEILTTVRRFGRSDFVLSKIKLPAVAEPSALLAGRRTTLLLPKTIIRGATIAVARENCL
jgi:cobalt-precorrin 5A hydrolase